MKGSDKASLTLQQKNKISRETDKNGKILIDEIVEHK